MPSRRKLKRTAAARIRAALLYSVWSDVDAQQVSITLFDKHGAATCHLPPALAEQMALLILDEVAKCRCDQ